MQEQAFWDKRHDAYAATDWIDEPTLFAKWAVSYLPKAGKLLELGAGQAQDSRYFADLGYQVTATDFSAQGLELAKQKSVASIAFQQVDLSRPLPFADESFDVVYGHMSLHYFDTITTTKLFAEIRRVLQPGGVLAALMNTTTDPEAAEGTPIEPDFRQFDPLKKRYFSPESARAFAKDFEIRVADGHGTTYKDKIDRLIRLVAVKPKQP